MLVEVKDEEEKVSLSEEKLKAYLELLCLVLLLMMLILEVCFDFLFEGVFFVLVFLCFGVGRVLLVKCSSWEVEKSESSEEED